MSTNLLQELGVRYPIIQAGMQRLGRAELAGAVSNNGGLGVITAASFDSKENLEKEIIDLKRKTRNPFALNISIGRRVDPTKYFEVAIEQDVKIIFTSGRNPKEYVNLIKAKDTFWAHSVTSVRHAKKVEELGADAVVATGYEAGGHPGLDQVSGLVLVPTIVKAVNIPVIAAGGIATGEGIVAALSLGAEAAILGTRFILTEESVAHSNTKEAYLQAKETDTIVIEKTMKKNHRVLNTNAANKVLELENINSSKDEILSIINGSQFKKTMEQGDLNAGVVSCGMGIGLINEVKSVENVIIQLVDEINNTFNRLSTFQCGVKL